MKLLCCSTPSVRLNLYTMLNKFKKMSKSGKIAFVAIVLIAIALFIMWWNSRDGAVAEGVTIVTPMPVSGYSVEDINNGMPNDLEEELTPTLAPVVGELSAEPVDVISATDTTAAPMPVDATTTSAAIEEFESFASNKWRGSIL